MKKRKKKNKPECSCDYTVPPPEFSDCVHEIKRSWLSLDIAGNVVYGVWEYGYFQRLVIYNDYCFPFWCCVSLN